MRARTSASQACGSTSLSLAVTIRVYMRRRPLAAAIGTGEQPDFLPRPSPVHSAHVGQELEVHYRCHPYFGRKVLVRRVEQRATGQFLKVEGPTGIVVSIAGWMLDPVICAKMTIGTPRVDLAALIELKRLLMGVRQLRKLPERYWIRSGERQ